MDYKGPISTLTTNKHASLLHYPCDDVVAYVTMEVEEGAMLGPYDEHLFVPWCQVNVLLTRLKKDSQLCRVIMELSWPHPTDISVNAFIPMDTYMGSYKKMRLPSASDLIKLIQGAGKGCFLYCCDISRAYM